MNSVNEKYVVIGNLGLSTDLMLSPFFVLANVATEKLPTIKIKEGISYKIEFEFIVSFKFFY